MIMQRGGGGGGDAYWVLTALLSVGSDYTLNSLGCPVFWPLVRGQVAICGPKTVAACRVRGVAAGEG